MNYNGKFVGVKIHGYCNGYFGRDSYNDKIIISSGENWIVAKEIYSNNNVFAEFYNSDEMQQMIEQWSEEDDDE